MFACAFFLIFPRAIHDTEELVNRQDEITLLKWTIAMEAEAEPYQGKLAVAWAIMNRARKWKQSISDVILKDRQFSAWNQDSPTRMRLDVISDAVMDSAEFAARTAYNYATLDDDPTLGATHYLNIELTKQIRGGTLPGWVNKLTQTVKIGKHTFYREA